MDFTDREVVVTGGTGALGRAVVARLLAAGARCHVPHRGRQAGLGRDLADRPELTLYPNVELTDESAVDAFYDSLPGLWASLQIAGGFAMAPIEATGRDTFRAMMEANAMTCLLCCRAAVRTLRAGGDGGRLVNVAARPALEPRGGSGMTAYAASKAAVAALTQALAQELAAERIWVNAVLPSIIDTPANREAMPKADHAKWPKVGEIAETIVFLASPENRSTRGALVPVYGQS